MPSIEVHCLYVAELVAPGWHPRAGDTIPVYAFAVRHPEGLALFDTGIGPPHSLIDQHYAARRFDLREQLEQAGERVENVSAIINCHLHFDHCGNNQMFAGTRTLVQSTELEAASIPSYTIQDFVEFPHSRYEAVHGDAEPFPGIRLIPTPGHSPGHQSAVLNTDAGTIILAGQAAESADEFERPELIAGENTSQRSESLARLKAFDPVRVYFSHDHAVWERTNRSS
jgi:glyoxylase-like metal-dependent hydrolase (beta-lactamase superfamily II)